MIKELDFQNEATNMARVCGVAIRIPTQPRPPSPHCNPFRLPRHP
jgi:hypothetical protein